MARYRTAQIDVSPQKAYEEKAHDMTLLQAGISIFGWFDMDPALFAFAFIILVFGGLNFLEYKRFD